MTLIEDRVAVTRRAGVAEVQLLRPDKMNALDEAMFRALAQAAATVAADTTVRAVVLSGEGRAFSAGIDLSALNSLVSEQGRARLAERTHGPANLYQQAVLAWADVPVPVIAALHGVAFGGALQLALGADMRIAAPETKMSIMEVRWGIVPDMAGTVTLRRLVREDVARDLIYTGRVFLAEEAVTLGLVTRLASALETAATIAQQSPRAVRAAKELLEKTLNCSVAEALQAESAIQLELLGGPDQREALAAHAEKRPPVYADIG